VDLQDRFQGVLMEQEKSRVLDEIREENNRVRDRADIDNRFATLRSSVEEVQGVYDMQLENLEEHVKTLRDETNETALKFAEVDVRLNELRAHVFAGREQDGECRDSLRLLSKRIDVQTVACLALHRRIDNKQAHRLTHVQAFEARLPTLGLCSQTIFPRGSHDLVFDADKAPPSVTLTTAGSDSGAASTISSAMSVVESRHHSAPRTALSKWFDIGLLFREHDGFLMR